MHNPRTVNVRLTAMLGALWLMAACSSPPTTFSLTGATVDPAYWCPGGANDAPYTVHATILARNDTSKEVTIDSVTADMRLTSVSGSWLEHVGDRYDAGPADVAPSTVAPRSSARLAITFASACSSAQYGGGSSSSGAYEVTLHLVTSAGKFSVRAADKHEIRAA